jgi:Undecaprenyl-phosphate glucose phosphotransferase
MIVNKKSIQHSRLLSDLILLNVSFLAAAILAQSWGILLERNYMFILEVGLNTIWYFSSTTTGFYDDFYARYFSYQFTNIIKNVIIQILVSIIFIFIVKEDLFTRNFIIYLGSFLTVTVSLRTIIFKYTLRAIRQKGRSVRNLLIIGAGEVGQNFYSMINENPDFGYNFVGFINGYKGGKIENENIIGNIEELEKIIKEKEVEEVVIAIPGYETNLLNQIIRKCNISAVKTHIIPDYFKFVSKKFQVSMIGDFPIISVRNEPLDEANWRFVKRVYDILFSLVVLILIFSWLFPLFALLIKIDSKGKVFFIQKRLGVKNEKFNCYKFRTLREAKAKDDKFSPVTENDSRVTKFGRFLRTTNLDELPQFINVLKGDMSIVGPRPYPSQYTDMYRQFVEEINIRGWVKPGITGWAQVHGLRGDVVDEKENRKRISKRIEYDLWYIENWSIWLDIQIILLTVWQMITVRTQAV